jgi:drug/metabolite transporter (DMT)-like permease
VTPGIVGLVLLAAAMHAIWNSLVKSSRDPLTELAVLNLAGGGAGLAMLPFTGFPGWPSAPFLALNLLFHSAYYAFLLRSYSAGGLSLVYPIARGSAPLLVAATSALVLDESIGVTGWTGVALVAVSIASLALSGGVLRLQSRAILFSLVTGATIAGYTLVDGAGARLATSPFSYIACMFVGNAFLLLPALRVLRRGVVGERLALVLRRGLFSGVLSFAAYGIAVWAMTRAPIAPVAALRETSVVFAALIGALFLGEPFGRFRIAAATGVAAGVVLLRLAG